MSNRRNKYQARENRQRVRRVLNEHWDPIGVVRDPDHGDEYDNYVGTVYVMLMDQRLPQDAINRYLYDTAAGCIGVSPGEKLTESCARTAAVFGRVKTRVRNAMTGLPVAFPDLICSTGHRDAGGVLSQKGAETA
jgi:hypothetical protein